MPAPGRTRLLAALLCLLTLAAPARADEVTGTWTGLLEGYGNYYLERSTRVVMPTMRVTLQSPVGLDVAANYLVDIISSASIAQTGSDEDAVFHEYRQQAEGQLVYRSELPGGQPLTLGARFGYSFEDDYRSRQYTGNARLSLDERNLDLDLAADPNFAESRRALTLNSAATRVLNARTTLTLGYTFSWVQGFQANPYRRALIGPLPFAEEHPERRLRHAVFGRLGHLIAETGTGVHLIYRTYVDSWNITALNPELRLVQTLHPDFLVSLGYRFYIQNSAWFVRAPAYPLGWEGPVTNDPKLAEHRTHKIGARIDVRLRFFEHTPLGFLGAGSVVVTFDRYLNTNAFGDGYIATVGGRLPL